MTRAARRSPRSFQHLKTATACAALAFLAACGGDNTADADADGGELQTTDLSDAAVTGSVCFFEHANFQGAAVCTTSSSGWVGSRWNDRISSVKVPAGYQLQLYQHAGYTGRTVTFTGDAASLSAHVMNDETSSLRIRTATATPPPAPTPPPPAPTPPAPPPPAPAPAPTPAPAPAPAPTPAPAPAPTPGPTTPTGIAGVQIAQSLLFNSDDSALVLVSGKAALVKVNVTNANPKAAKSAGLLRVTNPTTGVSRDIPLTLPTGDLPTAVPAVPSFADSYTATVPADLVKPGLTLAVSIGTGSPVTLTPRVGGGVAMRLVPISVRIGTTSGQVPVDQAAHLNALFPVSSVTTKPHAVYVSGRVTTVPATESAWSDAFSKILRELADLRLMEGAAAHDFYYGFIPKRTWGLAGLAYVPGRAGVGFDMPSSPTAVRDTLAHELGHNFSLPHAACGGAGSPDPSYPYPDANLGKPGRYIWPYLSDTNTFYDPRPTDRHDMMSYCGGTVFSDYNYRKMQTYLTPADKSVASAPTGNSTLAVPAAQELLLISGEIGAGGAITLNPVKSLAGNRTTPAAGDYVLRLVTASGVTDHVFDAQELDHDAGKLHFGFTVPSPGVIQSVAVLKGGQTVYTSQAPASGLNARIQSAGGSTPSVQVQESAGEARLTWDGSRYLTVTWTAEGQRRTLAQDLRGGTAVLPTADLPAGGAFEFILSDGLNSVRSVRNR